MDFGFDPIRILIPIVWWGFVKVHVDKLSNVYVYSSFVICNMSRWVNRVTGTSAKVTSLQGIQFISLVVILETKRKSEAEQKKYLHQPGTYSCRLLHKPVDCIWDSIPRYSLQHDMGFDGLSVLSEHLTVDNTHIVSISYKFSSII